MRSIICEININFHNFDLELFFWNLKNSFQNNSLAENIICRCLRVHAWFRNVTVIHSKMQSYMKWQRFWILSFENIISMRRINLFNFISKSYCGIFGAIVMAIWVTLLVEHFHYLFLQEAFYFKALMLWNTLPQI